MRVIHPLQENSGAVASIGKVLVQAQGLIAHAVIGASGCAGGKSEHSLNSEGQLLGAPKQYATCMTHQHARGSSINVTSRSTVTDKRFARPV